MKDGREINECIKFNSQQKHLLKSSHDKARQAPYRMGVAPKAPPSLLSTFSCPASDRFLKESSGGRTYNRTAVTVV